MMEKYGAVVDKYKVVEIDSKTVVASDLTWKQAESLASQKSGRIIEEEK